MNKIFVFVLSALVYFYVGTQSFNEIRETVGGDGDWAVVLTKLPQYDHSEREYLYFYEFINNKWILYAISPRNSYEYVHCLQKTE